MQPDQQLRMIALGTAQQLFQGREDFSVKDVLQAAEAFLLFLEETDEVQE